MHRCRHCSAHLHTHTYTVPCTLVRAATTGTAISQSWGDAGTFKKLAKMPQLKLVALSYEPIEAAVPDAQLWQLLPQLRQLRVMHGYWPEEQFDTEGPNSAPDKFVAMLEGLSTATSLTSLQVCSRWQGPGPRSVLTCTCGFLGTF